MTSTVICLLWMSRSDWTAAQLASTCGQPHPKGPMTCFVTPIRETSSETIFVKEWSGLRHFNLPCDEEIEESAITKLINDTTKYIIYVCRTPFLLLNRRWMGGEKWWWLCRNWLLAAWWWLCSAGIVSRRTNITRWARWPETSICRLGLQKRTQCQYHLGIWFATGKYGKAWIWQKTNFN